MNLTLILPGQSEEERSQTTIHIEYAGDGCVLRSIGADPPRPTYYRNSQEAKEGIIKDAYEYLEAGYRIYTGDGET